ncbi:MAG: TetR/AcrR family transcriptional regulator [Candidatus Ornithospirochaeta sp.]
MNSRRNTKEEIVDVALELFSIKGFDATSLSDISSRLSLTKAALFKHFSSKDEILSSVLKMMDDEDRKRAEEMNVPVSRKIESEEEYRNVKKKDFLYFALSQFEYWTENKRAVEYRRFLSLERFIREDLRKKWDENFVSGPLSYTRDVLESLEIEDYERKAMRLWSQMFLSYSLSDAGEEGERLKKNLKLEISEILEVENEIQ